eukprot:6599534-Heterocapsa_arctica.AAC.1
MHLGARQRVVLDHRGKRGEAWRRTWVHAIDADHLQHVLRRLVVVALVRVRKRREVGVLGPLFAE